ncbi:MAG: ABC transporter permease [SAR324 cluster bacterium]|uniref:ABC transporter permease n=1 Tax=SAR324 cluster bacterium TaxID=2024889 RepID=A0A7X9FTU8_9DELT|nr:ABC transporter permease [SAR324 cluster bacterium]
MKQFNFSKKVALRYLWTRRSEAFITIITVISVLGVAIGVMVLNVTMAIMTGFEHELRDKILGANAHITVKSLDGVIYNWQKVDEAIKEIPGVNSVSAFTYHQALARSDTRATGLLIRGIQKGSAAAEQLSKEMGTRQEIGALFSPPSVPILNVEGEESEASLPGLVVGRELTRILGVFPGQALSIMAPQVSSSPFGLMPRFKRFVVVGTYKGLMEYESGVAYANLEEAQKFFQTGEGVSGLEVRINDIYKAPVLAQEILSRTNSVAPGIYAQDWTEMNKPLWDAMKLERNVYFIVLLLIIIMASFSIISTLVMLVLEKRKDIAVLKTLGATSKSIGNIFRIQGAVIGGIGTILGLILGYTTCVLLREYGFPLDERIFQMSRLPIHIHWLNFTLVGVAAFSICCLATIYPAWRASSLSPSEVLRY